MEARPKLVTSRLEEAMPRQYRIATENAGICVESRRAVGFGIRFCKAIRSLLQTSHLRAALSATCSRNKLNNIFATFTRSLLPSILWCLSCTVAMQREAPSISITATSCLFSHCYVGSNVPHGSVHAGTLTLSGYPLNASNKAKGRECIAALSYY